jgi:mevalonate kinase
LFFNQSTHLHAIIDKYYKRKLSKGQVRTKDGSGLKRNLFKKELDLDDDPVQEKIYNEIADHPEGKGHNELVRILVKTGKINKTNFETKLKLLVAREIIIQDIKKKPYRVIYRISQTSRNTRIEEYLEIMKDYPIVAMAPFCPIIAGAHAVMHKEPALVLPLNAYACIGLKESFGKGGNIKMELERRTDQQSTAPAYADIERVKDDTITTICMALGLKREQLPNYEAKLALDIDISLGCGSSGAVAVAIILGWLATPKLKSLTGKELLASTGKISSDLEVYNIVKNAACNLEQYIHGRRFLPIACEPYSSGASIICSMEADLGKVLEYRLESWTKPSNEQGLYTFEGQARAVCEEIPFSMALVLGEPKHTSQCLKCSNQVKETLPGGIDESFFRLWGWVAKKMRECMNQNDKTETILERTAVLLRIQNGLYSCLGLDNQRFNELIKAISSTRPVSRTGGSIIGGGMDGTCLIVSDKIDVAKQKIELNYPNMQILPDHMLGKPVAAQLIKIGG